MKVDHYVILNLPSGIRGTKLSLQEIRKAYKLKELKLHPDKRRNDPNAHKKFQRLLNSYEILKEKKTRKGYDDRIRAKHEEALLRKAWDEERMRREKMRKERELAEEKAQDEERKNLTIKDGIILGIMCLFFIVCKYVKMKAEMNEKKEPEAKHQFFSMIASVMGVKLSLFGEDYEF